jgi:aminoglycoside phosphotransferase (APT) family kinase protein
MGIIDEPTSPRSGEELDSKKVEEFLKDSVPGLKGEVAIKQFPGGHSNLTYLVKVGDRELVLRRPPFGKKAKSAHDMSREYKMLSALKPVFKYCPAPVVYSEDPAVMDCPFYVMERIKGIILRKEPPEGLNLSRADIKKLCEKFIDVLHELHAVDYKKIGLGDYGKPEGYVRRQVEGWSRRYRDARTPDAPDFEKVMEWLVKRMPPESAVPGVIHNDYKFDNVILDPKNPTEIIGVLDWEMSTIGDPLMDFGCTLSYWIDDNDPPNLLLIRVMSTQLEGKPARPDLIKYYFGLSGKPAELSEFYYCFGLFRLAVILQQIYYRYYHGQTKDERFKMMVFAERFLEEAALLVVDRVG